MARAWWLLGLAAIVVIGVVWLAEWRPAPMPPAEAPSVSPADAEAALPPVLRGAAEERPEAETDALEPAAVEITGRVIRSGSREPITGAEIRLERDEEVLTRAKSQSDGRFRLGLGALPEPPAYHHPCLLIARAQGTTTLRAIPPDDGALTSQDVGDVELLAGWTVRGIVRGEDGAAIAGAQIEFLSSEPGKETRCMAGSWDEIGMPVNGESDADGQFQFEGVPPRPFRLQVVAPGHVTGYFHGSASRDGAWLDIRLRRGQSVRVRVVDREGEAVAGATVNLYPGYRVTFAGHYKTFLRLDRSATTRADGTCMLTGLDERNYEVTAQAAGRGADGAYVRAGWTEVVLKLRPGWRSSRYAYEDGPGGTTGPPWLHGPFAWRHAAPEEPGPEPTPPPPTPPEDPEPPAETPDPEPAEEERKPPPHLGWVRVRVLSADGLPMPRVFVNFEGPDDESEITENDGTESFALAPGRYDYRASPLDFGTPAGDLRGTMDVAGGVIAEVDLVMPEVYSVRIEVRDARGEILPKVRLEILRGDEDEQDRVGPDGTTTLFAERGEPFSIYADPDGLPVAFLPSVTVPPPGPVVLRVPETREIRGRVVDPAGAPIFGVRVVARREGLERIGKEVRIGWTDDGGHFVVKGPSVVGAYEVTAMHKAFGAATARVAPGEGSPPLALRLRPLARLRGRVTDTEGRGISEAKIEVKAERGGWVGSRNDGRFEVTLPGTGEAAKIRVGHDDFIPSVVPAKASASPLEVRLSRGVGLKLQIRCTNGLRFDVRFEDPATGERLLAQGGSRLDVDDGVLWQWAHAPEGKVRIRLDPNPGQEVVLDYAAREGDTLELETTIP